MKLSVSVIMPTFNSEHYISDTIESVRNQTHTDWELWVIDDCSKDDTVATVTEIAKNDPRIKIIQLESNGGAAVARSAGIKKSTGRYIAFLDSDDKWDIHKLEKQIGFMEAHNVAFSHTGYRRIQAGTGASLSEYIPSRRLTYKDMLYSNHVGCLTAMFDTEKVGRITMPDIRKRQDYAMWLKILRQVESVHGLQEVLASYTVRDDSISSNKVSLLRYNYSVFRDCEGFSRTASLFYLFANVFTRIQRGRS